MTSVEGVGGALVVMTIGVVMLASLGGYVVEYDVIGDEEPLVSPGEILESVNLLVVLAAAGTLFYGAWWLVRTVATERGAWLVGFWCAGGFVGSVLLVVFLQAHWLVEGVAPPLPWLIQQQFVAGAAGAVAGLLVGVYNVRMVRNQRKLEVQRDAFAVVNEFLRHHVLNGMQIVQGYTDRLYDTADEEERACLDRVDERSEVVVELVRRVNALMASISRETTVSPVDLSAIVRSEVATLREEYADVDVEADVQGPIHVLADDLLDEVVSNLLVNAVEHNDADSPRVVVSIERTGDTARFSVADNGPGLPEERVDRIFEPGESGPRKVGRGFGLYLVDALVQRYGGEIRVGDSDIGGLVFAVDLPRP